MQLDFFFSSHGPTGRGNDIPYQICHAILGDDMASVTCFLVCLSLPFTTLRWPTRLTDPDLYSETGLHRLCDLTVSYIITHFQ